MTETTGQVSRLAAYEKSVPFGPENLVLSTGKLAKQANATVIASVGGTIAMAAVVMAPPSDVPRDFFPLTVDYREKAYAAGRMPGGYFKREGRPGEAEILRARLIDRPLRPMFPEGFRQEIQVYITILSFDGKNSADVAALTAASAALIISDIPFHNPVAAVRVGYDGTNYILNPTLDQQKTSKLDLIVAGTKNAITMVESGAQMLTEEQMLEALRFGHEHVKQLCEAQEAMRADVGKPKQDWQPPAHDEALHAKIRELAKPHFEKIATIYEKHARTDALAACRTTIIESLEGEYPEIKEQMKEVFEEEYSRTMREAVLNTNTRADGRKLDEIRDISVDLGVLPRTHGSAVFTRGQTQSLGVLTLGTGDDTQDIDDLEEVGERKFYLHYNFPSYSVGEVRRMMGPGRREIGHGALAARSIEPIIPDHDKFPYTIRLVSEILESNGSSSMASVCSGVLAMMDGGVPIKAPVAGIAMGLILEGDRYAVLSDIMGLEDHLGDMDFKVSGTADGITALQMDIKIEGVTLEIMEKALHQAKAGRIHILGKMNEAIQAPREEMSLYAPRIETIWINPEKIKDVIGSGGKIIKEIVAKTGAKIDIDDSGKVAVASSDGEAMARAIQWIKDLTAEAEIGKVYTGKVNRIAEFGCFVEILPGKDGLVHISELEPRRVEKVEDVCQIGDEILVKVIGIDDRGKIRLSRKQAMHPELGDGENGGISEGARRDRGDRGERGERGDRGPRDRGDRGDRGPRGGRDRDRGGDRGPRGGRDRERTPAVRSTEMHAAGDNADFRGDRVQDQPLRDEHNTGAFPTLEEPTNQASLPPGEIPLGEDLKPSDASLPSGSRFASDVEDELS
jgi:polyribonucleotide nucleotidyltransferase